MQRLYDIYEDLHQDGVKLYACQIGYAQAATIETDSKYAIFVDATSMTMAEETVLIAHESGHIMTGATHKVSSELDLISRHENRANKWAIKKLIPKDELDAAVTAGNTEVWELAEHFDVTEDFMRKAMEFYHN